MTHPILYSFRRCPYAMRARLAILSSGVTVTLREIVLRDKAPEFVASFPNGTVPGLILPDGQTIAESRDIMAWALGQSDPENWLEPPTRTDLIDRADGEFKTALDRYKYASRYEDVDRDTERGRGLAFLSHLNDHLIAHPFLGGASARLADMAILPFVRQFAFVDRDWFHRQPIPGVHGWLDRFLQSQAFTSIMKKYPKWTSGDPATRFPDATT